MSVVSRQGGASLGFREGGPSWDLSWVLLDEDKTCGTWTCSEAQYAGYATRSRAVSTACFPSANTSKLTHLRAAQAYVLDYAYEA